jgi:hypothetical protein
MKIQTTALMLMTGLLALVNLPAAAQDRPDATPAPPKPAEPGKPGPDAPPPPLVRPKGDLIPPRGPDRVLAEKKVPYIGLLTGPVSEELSAQFSLGEGFGLQVVEVMPDSPAQEAGLKVHDVLVEFENQKLVNMDQLQTLVRSKRKDDSINLSVISGGQRKIVTVKAGERKIQVDEDRPRGGFGMPPNMHFFERRDGNGPEDWRERAEQFQNRIRDYQKRMEEWTREGRKGTMPPPPMFDMPRGDGSGTRRDGGDEHPRDGERGERGGRGGDRGPGGSRDGDWHRPESPRGGGMPQRPEGEGGDRGRGEIRRSEYRAVSESASITRSDETGIYSLRKDGERSVFSAKPKDGESKEWPVNTDEERAAVPEPFRTKLREMEEIRSSVRRDEAGSRSSSSQDAPPPARRPEGT